MEQSENPCPAAEPGSMNRRQLLQALSVLAAAAAALPFRAEAAPAFKPIWLNQYTYVAPDMAATADWYVEVFGMQRGMATARETHLWFGDVQGDTLMIVRQAQAGDTAPALTRFGFTINYWDRDFVRAELERRGLDPQPDTDKGFWFGDLEGNEIGVFAADWMERTDVPSVAALQRCRRSARTTSSSSARITRSWPPGITIWLRSTRRLIPEETSSNGSVTRPGFRHRCARARRLPRLSVHSTTAL